jgi:hypothetical protein
MKHSNHSLSRRDFLAGVAQAGIAVSLLPGAGVFAAASPQNPVIAFPGPWSFMIPKGAIITVTDKQIDDLQDPDREVDLSLSGSPNITTLRKVCEQNQANGAKTVILAFDHFWAQYRKGQGEKPRELMPDTDAYIQRIQRIGETLKKYGLGLELSLLSPLELGQGYAKATGERGRWVQYREGNRDPKSGEYSVALWEHRRWTNNKGSIDIQRAGIRVFAFRESRIGGTSYYHVNPADVVELREEPEIAVWEGARADMGNSFAARRLVARGKGGPLDKGLDRVLAVVSYDTPEMDYFSPKALPFLKDLVDRYHRAGVPLNGLYSDEMHIQQDWVYHAHHDEGQFALRYLTPNLSKAFAQKYGGEFEDLEKHMVYFCHAQHGFYSDLEARLPAQHTMGGTPADIHKTFLFRRRYYDLLSRTVVGLFTGAREYAESLYGHELEARAHATWAQSPTIDAWESPGVHHPTKQYEYTSDFLWSNTVQQAACACDDYFRWNDFLTGGGNDHTEGGWSDRDYYALALACSTGILNRVPYAYAAHWGLPRQASERRQALVDAYGAAASPSFQAVENSEHRDVDVLMLYPLSLVACEERFGSWMTQYGYANYVTPDRLLERGRVNASGKIEMAGRTFGTLVVLFEPLPPAGLIAFLEKFAAQGGKLIWSGPPPRLDLDNQPVLEPWQRLFGVQELRYGHQGIPCPGMEVKFEGTCSGVPPQTILTHFLVDHVYPVQPSAGAEAVARVNGLVAGVYRKVNDAGVALYLGFRPRDDQSASLGYESRTWYAVLKSMGAYPSASAGENDNPSVISRESPYLACRFPNGTVAIAAHYRSHKESWPGGFHRNEKEDDEIVLKNPLPPEPLMLQKFRIQGRVVDYTGRLVMAYRLGQDAGAKAEVKTENRLLAFAGYQCESISVDGVLHRFASKPMGHMAWAPVAENRRVPNGAVLEIWSQGDADVRIPVNPNLKNPRLCFAGNTPGGIGGEIAAKLDAGALCFESKGSWPTGHLYLLAES